MGVRTWIEARPVYRQLTPQYRQRAGLGPDHHTPIVTAPLPPVEPGAGAGETED